MFKIMKHGKDLDSSLYSYCSTTNTLITTGGDVDIRYSSPEKATIIAGANSKIEATGGCFIKSGDNSTIIATGDSIISAGEYCNIETTGHSCIQAKRSATINAGENCIISVGSYSKLYTSALCTIIAGSDSTIKAGGECVVSRQELYEVIQMYFDDHITLNGYGIPGYVNVNEKVKAEIIATKEDIKKIKELINIEVKYL